MSAPPGDALLDRLRELSLVEVEAMVAGVPAEARAGVLAALADDLADALAAARERAAKLAGALARLPEPLAVLDAPAGARARDGGAALLERARGAAGSRAEACRQLARLDAVADLVLPRLVEVERLLAGGAR